MKQSARLFSSNGIFALNIDNSTAADTLCEFVLSCILEIDLHLAGTIGLRKKTGNAEPIYIFTHRKNIPWAFRQKFGEQKPVVPLPRIEIHDNVTVVRDD